MHRLVGTASSMVLLLALMGLLAAVGTNTAWSQVEDAETSATEPVSSAEETATEEAVTEEAVESEAQVEVETAVVEDEAVETGEEAAGEEKTGEAEEEEKPVTAEMLLGWANVLWVCLAGFLVFFMQAGFAMVEAGFTRAKNACNIIMKNLMDFALGSLAFWAVGFGLMFGVPYALGQWGGVVGLSNFFYEGKEPFDWAFIFFQTMFAATAATIVSGAMAERTKFVSYLIYTVAITIFIYPIFGCWVWNGTETGGWLTKSFGFHDFAGSTVVHSIGAWCALAGAFILGPRIGKYSKDGRMNAIPGHNIPIAALGVFILWLGWFGFNAGSTVAIDNGDFALIAFVTNIGAAAGAITAMIASWILFKKPDASFSLNGALAGLVAVTAGCNVFSPAYAALAGAIGGVIVVLSVVAFDKIRIDDPVGAVSVHGVVGVWGTLAVGLFGFAEGGVVGLVYGGGIGPLLVQALGAAVAFVWAFGLSVPLFLLLKYTVGLRVPPEEEIEGLDVHEHGMHAYPASAYADSYTGANAPGVSLAMPGMSGSMAKAASEGVHAG